MTPFDLLIDTEPINFGKTFVSFITGAHNDDRISLEYFHAKSTGVLYAKVQFGRLAQGPPGHAHGGAISAVFDELMGACCWVNGLPAMTAQYTTRFFKPVPLYQDVLYAASIKDRLESKINVKAKLISLQTDRLAQAKGLFILQDMETFKKMSHTGSGNEAYLQELTKHT